LLIVLAGQLFLLRSLPYSKAFLVSKTVKEALSQRDPLTLSDLHWYPGPYLYARSLEPMRVVVRTYCSDLAPFETATCLANFFARRFHHGTPKHEFFDSDYNPAENLSNHLAGEPGHCVTRSGLLATTLLAVGIPARVVQIVPLDGSGGHNVLEIWDPKRGWLMMDPTYGGSLEVDNIRTSAIVVPTESVNPRWRKEAVLHKVMGVNSADAQRFYNEQRLMSSNIVYPEPWLYTRVGESVAPRLFQGKFVSIGSTSLRIGLGQRLLQSGILFTLLSLMLTLGMLAFRVVQSFQRRTFMIKNRGHRLYPKNTPVLETIDLPR
jgi:hypothetical protein